MDARQKLVIRASASMHGDIRSPSPTIEEGALFKGKIETA
jgi:cytoskeletal protein CcmA (bactofilin family)